MAKEVAARASSLAEITSLSKRRGSPDHRERACKGLFDLPDRWLSVGFLERSSPEGRMPSRGRLVGGVLALDDPVLLRGVAVSTRLPSAGAARSRVSKLQPCLPDALLAELLADALLDVHGARASVERAG